MSTPPTQTAYPRLRQPEPRLLGHVWRLERGSGACRGASDSSSGFAPAAEDEAADREAETERPESERADRDGLPPQREPLPATDRFLFLGAQGLAAPLLPYCAAGPETEIDVVEDLG
jgi:hypothetical protein